MKTIVEQERKKLYDLAKSYLSEHDELSPEEKQAWVREIEHQKERLSKVKNNIKMGRSGLNDD